MTSTGRPEWAEVSRSALSLELWAIAQEYKAEGDLWHNDACAVVVFRAWLQLERISVFVADSSTYIEQGEAYLKAARMMLPKIQTSRERRSLGLGLIGVDHANAERVSRHDGHGHGAPLDDLGHAGHDRRLHHRIEQTEPDRRDDDPHEQYQPQRSAINHEHTLTKESRA